MARTIYAVLWSAGKGKTMKNSKNILERLSMVACCIMVFSAWNACTLVLYENSVSVDSVWNSDSSWYDLNGILQQRNSRDCHISFLSQDTGCISQCTVSVSLDSGKTWAPNPNPLCILVNCVDSTVHQGQKANVVVRVLGQDRPNVVFKVETNICKTTPLKDLIITNQISGWVIDSTSADTAMNITDANSSLFWDGGNGYYCGQCNGTGPFRGGFVTYFRNPAKGYNLTCFVLNYGTPLKAKTEYDTWVNMTTGNTLEAISPFASTTAVGLDESGGLIAYANLSNIYMQLQFTNYASSSLAISDASVFLNYYNSVMSQ
jgi:hypothetical protein